MELHIPLKEQKVKNFCFSDDVMIGFTHEERIANWLQLFGIDSENKDVGSLRKKYRPAFIKYSSKNGVFVRWETILKRELNYQLFPGWLKSILRLVKGVFGLHRER